MSDTPAIEWDAKSAYAKRPTIQVVLRKTGEVVEAKTHGVEKALVTVYLDAYGLYHTQEYDWATIARALNKCNGMLYWGIE